MDMYGSVVSNNFHVKDEGDFREWFEKYRFGDDISVERGEKSTREDGLGTEMCFSGFEQYPSAWPKTPGNNEGDIDEVEVDLENWVQEIREHLLPDEIVYVIACGAEGGRYAAAQELAVSHLAHGFRDMCTDNRRCAQRLLDEQESQRGDTATPSTRQA